MAETEAPETPRTQAPPLPATEMWYCDRCGRVDTFLTARIAKMKQSPSCSKDSMPLQPFDSAIDDPDVNG